MWRRGVGSEEVGSSMTLGVLQSGVKSRKLHNPNQSYYTLKFVKLWQIAYLARKDNVHTNFAATFRRSRNVA